MNLETLVIFGMGIQQILFLLIENAGNVKLLPNPTSKYVAGGVLSALTVVAWAFSEDKMPKPILLWGLWLGLWVLSIMTSAAVKWAVAKAQEPVNKE